MKFFPFLINSNIYIALGAVALCIETQIQIGIEPAWQPYLFLVFFATLFEYNLHRLINVFYNKGALEQEKHKWVKANLQSFYLVIVISCIGFFISLLYAKKEVLFILIPFAIVTILYSLPVIKKSNHLFRLREIPFIKIFLISMVWSAVTILLPVIHSGNFFTRTVFLMMLERIIFVVAITIPFDIRDMDSDREDGLKTIPLYLGAKRSLDLATQLLLIFMGICILHYFNTRDYMMILAFIISGISSLYFIRSKKLQEYYYYHYVILDGTLLIQGLLVFLLVFI